MNPWENTKEERKRPCTSACRHLGQQILCQRKGLGLMNPGKCPEHTQNSPAGMETAPSKPKPSFGLELRTELSRPAEAAEHISSASFPSCCPKAGVSAFQLQNIQWHNSDNVEWSTLDEHTKFERDTAAFTRDCLARPVVLRHTHRSAQESTGLWPHWTTPLSPPPECSCVPETREMGY